MDDHGVGVGDVQPRLNDGSGHKDVDLPVDKGVHDLLQLMLPHLPVGKGHRHIRHQPLDPGRHLDDVLHPVVDVVHLPLAGALPLDGLPHHLIVVLHDIGLDGHPLLRRLLQDAHVPDADEAHVERPRDRSGGQSQYVDIFLQLFDLLLVLHAEPLLLVDDEEP